MAIGATRLLSVLTGLTLWACVPASGAETDTSPAGVFRVPGSEGGTSANDASTLEAGALDGEMHSGLGPGETLVTTPPQLRCGPPDCARCEESIIALDVMGTSPMGDFRSERATLEYADGGVPSTTVTVYGKLADQDVALVVSFDDHGQTDSVRSYTAVASDSYQPTLHQQTSVGLDRGQSVRRADGLVTSVVRYLAATVIVEEHEYDPWAINGDEGDPLPAYLRGVLEVDEPGWSLRIPFEFDGACSLSIYL